MATAPAAPVSESVYAGVMKSLLPCMVAAAMGLLSPLFLGCSGDSSGSGGASGTLSLDLCFGEVDPEGVPPPAVEDAAPAGAETYVFAMRAIRLGSLEPDGELSATAWKGLGLNLDGFTTTKDNASCGCQWTASAKPSMLADGDAGRDNSFGRSIMPILTSLASDIEVQTAGKIKGGGFSWLFALHGLGGDGARKGLSAEAYAAAPFVDAAGMPAAPAWDETDTWRVSAESVDGGDIGAPKLRFQDAYTVPATGGEGGSIWVGHGKGTLPLFLPGGAPPFVHLVIHDPVLVLPISSDHTQIQRGVLGGTLESQTVAMEMTRLIGIFYPEGCPPSDFAESLGQEILSASDATEGDPSQHPICSLISIGVEIEAVRAQIGDVAPPVELDPGECAM